MAQIIFCQRAKKEKKNEKGKTKRVKVSRMKPTEKEQAKTVKKKQTEA